MKNNRSLVSSAETQTLLRNLGEPALIAGRIDPLEEEGQATIVELVPSIPEHRAAYEEIHNNPDKFEVVHETDFGGRGKCHVLVRFVRKGPWDINLPSPSGDSPKRSRRSPTGGKKSSVMGFGATPKKSSPKKEAPKKKSPAKRKRKKTGR
jgi:hypothetical protein